MSDKNGWLRHMADDSKIRRAVERLSDSSGGLNSQFQEAERAIANIRNELSNLIPLFKGSGGALDDYVDVVNELITKFNELVGMRERITGLFQTLESATRQGDSGQTERLVNDLVGAMKTYADTLDNAGRRTQDFIATFHQFGFNDVIKNVGDNLLRLSDLTSSVIDHVAGLPQVMTDSLQATSHSLENTTQQIQRTVSQVRELTKEAESTMANLPIPIDRLVDQFHTSVNAIHDILKDRILRDLSTKFRETLQEASKQIFNVSLSEMNNGIRDLANNLNELERIANRIDPKQLNTTFVKKKLAGGDVNELNQFVRDLVTDFNRFGGVSSNVFNLLGTTGQGGSGLGQFTNLMGAYQLEFLKIVQDNISKLPSPMRGEVTHMPEVRRLIDELTSRAALGYAGLNYDRLVGQANLTHRFNPEDEGTIIHRILSTHLNQFGKALTPDNQLTTLAGVNEINRAFGNDHLRNARASLIESYKGYGDIESYLNHLSQLLQVNNPNYHNIGTLTMRMVGNLDSVLGKRGGGLHEMGQALGGLNFTAGQSVVEMMTNELQRSEREAEAVKRTLQDVIDLLQSRGINTSQLETALERIDDRVNQIKKSVIDAQATLNGRNAYDDERINQIAQVKFGSRITGSINDDYRNIERNVQNIQFSAYEALLNRQAGNYRWSPFSQVTNAESIIGKTQEIQALFEKIEHNRELYERAVKSGDQTQINSIVRNRIANQNELNSLIVGLGGAMKLDKRDLEAYPDEIKRMYENMRSLLDAVEKSNNQTLVLSKVFGIDEGIQGLRKFKDELDGIKRDMGEAQDSSLFGKILGGARSVGSTLINRGIRQPLDLLSGPLNLMRGALGVIGLGELAGLLSPTGLIGGIMRTYREQGQEFAQASLAGSGTYGLGFGGMGVGFDVLRTGNDLQRLTNGLITQRDYVQGYINMVRGVGGQVGEDHTQAQQDMERFAKTSQIWQKAFGVSDSQMTDTINVFYRQFRMNISDTEFEMTKIAQTANQLNIPLTEQLSIVTNLAKQYREYGLSADMANNIVSNLEYNRGYTPQDAAMVGQAIGRGIGSMNEAQMAFAGLMFGGASNPMEAIYNLEYGIYDQHLNPTQQAERKAGVYIDMAKMFEEAVPGYTGRVMAGQMIKSMGITDPRAIATILNLDKESLVNYLKESPAGATAGTSDANRYLENIKAAGEQLSGIDKDLNAVHVTLQNIATDNKRFLDNITNFSGLIYNAGAELDKLIQNLGGLYDVFTKAEKKIEDIINALGGPKVLEILGAMAGIGWILNTFSPYIKGGYSLYRRYRDSRGGGGKPPGGSGTKGSGPIEEETPGRVIYGPNGEVLSRVPPEEGPVGTGKVSLGERLKGIGKKAGLLTVPFAAYELYDAIFGGDRAQAADAGPSIPQVGGGRGRTLDDVYDVLVDIYRALGGNVIQPTEATPYGAYGNLSNLPDGSWVGGRIGEAGDALANLLYGTAGMIGTGRTGIVTTEGAGKGLGFLGSLLKSPRFLLSGGLQLAATGIDFGIQAHDIHQIHEIAGLSDWRDYANTAAKTGAGLALTGGGAWAGAEAGAAIGTMIVPGIGTVGGGIIGGILGSLAGNWINNRLDNNGVYDSFLAKFGLSQEQIQREQAARSPAYMAGLQFQEDYKRSTGQDVPLPLAVMAGRALIDNKDKLAGLSQQQRDNWAATYVQARIQGQSDDQAKRTADGIFQLNLTNREIQQINQTQLQNLIALYNSTGEQKKTIDDWAKKNGIDVKTTQDILNQTAVATGVSKDQLISIAQSMNLTQQELAAWIQMNGGPGRLFTNNNDLNAMRDKLKSGTNLTEAQIGTALEGYARYHTQLASMDDEEKITWLKTYAQVAPLQQRGINVDPAKVADYSVRSLEVIRNSFGGLFNEARGYSPSLAEINQLGSSDVTDILNDFSKASGISIGVLRDQLRGQHIGDVTFASFLRNKLSSLTNGRDTRGIGWTNDLVNQATGGRLNAYLNPLNGGTSGTTSDGETSNDPVQVIKSGNEINKEGFKGSHEDITKFFNTYKDNYDKFYKDYSNYEQTKEKNWESLLQYWKDYSNNVEKWMKTTSDIETQLVAVNMNLQSLASVTSNITTGFGLGDQGAANAAAYYLNSGKFTISSPFGDTRDRTSPHKGVDFAAPYNTPIEAIMGGKVIKAGNYGDGFGNMVEIQSPNGYDVIYAHMIGTPRVKIGDMVTSGEIIGNVGSTGDSTGPHVHIQMTQNGTLVDPQKIMQQLENVSGSGIGGGGLAFESLSHPTWDQSKLDTRANEVINAQGYEKYKYAIQTASTKYGIPAALIASIIQQEDSSWNPDAGRYYKGLMQISPDKAIGGSASDPMANVMGGTAYLAGLLKQYNGDLAAALAAYNAGPNGNWNDPGVQAYVNDILYRYANAGFGFGGEGLVPGMELINDFTSTAGTAKVGSTSTGNQINAQDIANAMSDVKITNPILVDFGSHDAMAGWMVNTSTMGDNVVNYVRQLYSSVGLDSITQLKTDQGLVNMQQLQRDWSRQFDQNTMKIQVDVNVNDQRVKDDLANIIQQYFQAFYDIRAQQYS